jgi:hypothetical protein
MAGCMLLARRDFDIHGPLPGLLNILIRIQERA